MLRALTACFVALGLTCRVQAQEWELVRSLVAFEDTYEVEHIALAIEGDVLAIARCTPAGGTVRLYARNQGGIDQWESIAVIDDPRRGFGYSLALRSGRLAIGIRGDTLAGSDPGAVKIAEIDLANTQPMSLGEEYVPANGLAGDRFGHSVHWQGDTLFVGAIGRAHAKGSGAVYALAAAQNALVQLDMLQPDADDLQLPRLGDFGSSIVSDGKHLVVTSPGSGYNDSLVFGAMHVFAADADAPSGWHEQANVFDADLIPAEDDPLVRDLGREGIYLLDSQVVVHMASPYSQMEEVDDDGVARPLSDSAGCAACRIRTYRLSSDGEWVQGSTVQVPDGTSRRSRAGWYLDGDRAYVSGYDTATLTWRTVVHEWGEGMPLNALDTIARVDSCDNYNGPMLHAEGRLVRTSLRKGPLCTDDPSGREIIVEIFSPTSVGVPEPSSSATAELRLSPSPATGSCAVGMPIAGPWNISVLGVQGQWVRSVPTVAGSSCTIDLSGLAPGIYVVSADHVHEHHRLTARLSVY